MNQLGVSENNSLRYFVKEAVRLYRGQMGHQEQNFG